MILVGWDMGKPRVWRAAIISQKKAVNRDW
jgi:hypothetical protein